MIAGEDARHTPLSGPVERRKLDPRVWRTATWTMPFVTQLVLGIDILALWLLGKTGHFAHSRERAWFMTGAVATAVILAPIAGLLFFSSRSARIRGTALALAGSSALVLIGCSVFAYRLLR